MDTILECTEYGAGSCRNEDMIHELIAERDALHKILDDGGAVMAGSLAERISDVVADRDAAIAARDAARAEAERLREQVAVLRVALLAQKTTDDLYYSTYAISVSDTAWRDYSEAKEFAKSKMDAALKATEDARRYNALYS